MRVGSCNLSWWRHQMETFSALLALCAGNSLVTGEFPSQRPVTRSIDVFFELRLNKRLSKQPWSWWFETPSRSLWRHRNVYSRLSVASRHFLLQITHIRRLIIHPQPHSSPNTHLFTNMIELESRDGCVITSVIKCMMKLRIQFETSTVQ